MFLPETAKLKLRLFQVLKLPKRFEMQIYVARNNKIATNIFQELFLQSARKAIESNQKYLGGNQL